MIVCVHWRHMHMQIHSCILMLQPSPLLPAKILHLDFLLPCCVCCTSAFDQIASQHLLSMSDKAEREFLGCCRYKVADRFWEVEGHGGIFWRTSSSCVLTLQLVTQTQTVRQVSGAQLTYRGSTDQMVRFCSLSVWLGVKCHWYGCCNQEYRWSAILTHRCKFNLAEILQ